MQSRIGYCCTFVSPTGDDAELRSLCMRGPTIASIARPGGHETASRLEATILENLDTLDRQIARVSTLPALERLFRIQSNFLIGWSHPEDLADILIDSREVRWDGKGGLQLAPTYVDDEIRFAIPNEISGEQGEFSFLFGTSFGEAMTSTGARCLFDVTRGYQHRASIK